MRAFSFWTKSSPVLLGVALFFSIPLSSLNAQESESVVVEDTSPEQPAITPEVIAEDDSVEVVTEESSYNNLPPGSITFGATTQEDYAEGTGDILIPLFFNGQTMLFINPRSSFTDQNEEEFNFGVGIRQLVNEDSGIFGVNAYYDRRETELGSSFDQFGFGIEYLCSLFDARANIYVPFDDKELVREFERSESSVSQQRSSSSTTAVEAPIGMGNSVVQPTTITTVDSISTTTRTTTMGFREYETTMEGWDAEIGIAIPLPSLEEHIQAKLFGGYYSFNGIMGVEDSEGFRGRLEVQFFPNLLLDAVYYADDNFNGGNYSVGLYFSMPFDLTELIQGSNPFGNVGKLKDPNDMYLRLGEMVKRDPQIRTKIAAPVTIENSERTEETTQTSTVQTLTTNILAEIETDITFVDGDSGNDTNPGTFEQPKLTVQGGVDEPRSMVFVHEIDAQYEENVVLTDNVVLRGAGVPIVAMGGMMFGSGIHPIVDGGGNGPVIEMANNTSVTGFQIQNSPPTMVATQAQIQQAIIGTFVNLPNLGSTLVDNVGILGNNVTGLTINDNIIVGNDYGVLIDRLGDLQVSAARNNLISNNSSGALINGIGNSGTFDVELEENVATHNFGTGIEVSGVNYDEARLNMINNTTSSNGFSGIFTQLETKDFSEFTVTGHTANSNSIWGMQSVNISSGTVFSTVADSTFNSNGAYGLQLFSAGDDTSVVGVGGLTANENGLEGLSIFSESDNGISLVVGGLDPALSEYVETLVDVLGLGPLPPELIQILSANGPLVANGNNGNGIVVTSNGDFLSLAALFDLEANENGSLGALIEIDSENGFAAGLVSDSEGLTTTLDLVKDVVELLVGPTGVPDIPEIASGSMSFNSNGGVGIVMNVEGGSLALSIASGIEANNNTNGTGAIFNTSSSNGLAVGIAQNISASQNAQGIDARVDGEFFALNVLADVAAEFNGGDGIFQSTLSSNGIAVAAVASTDPIRSLIGLLNSEVPLDPAITLRGAPLGPVIASNNDGRGFTSVITSGGPAIGAFLDIQANSNGLNGIIVDIYSEDSIALGLLGSSDFLFDTLGELLAGQPVPHLPVGPVQANGNGSSGVQVFMDSDDASIFLGFGIEAMNNSNLMSSGNGVSIDQIASFETISILADINASGNTGTGLVVRTTTDDDVTVAVLSATLNNNEAGLVIDAFSDNEDIYTSVIGVTANTNLQNGILIRADAGDDAYTAVSGSQAQGNGERGLRTNISSLDDSELYVGGTNFLAGSFLGSLPPELLGLLPVAGTNNFSNNTGTGVSASINAGNDIDFFVGETLINDNGSQGLRAELLGEDDINIEILASEANNNVRTGFRVIAASTNSNIVATFSDNISTNNSSQGVSFEFTAPGTNTVTMNDNIITDNARNGVDLNLAAGTEVRAFGSRNQITDNGRNGLLIDATAPSTVLNFGQNGSGIGTNQFFGNANRDVRNSGAGTILAENNWWGADIDPVGNGQTAGSVDASPRLTTAP